MDIVKSVIRVTHLLTTAANAGQIIYNYMSDGELDDKIKGHPNYASFNTMNSTIIYLTGISMIFLTKGGKELTDPVHAMWMHFFELKFILGLFLTPLIYPLTGMFADEGEENISEAAKSKYQFYIVVFFCFYSPMTRWFREEVCQDFKVDIIMQKVMQLQDRYKQSAKSEKPLVEPPINEKYVPKNKTPGSKIAQEKKWMEDQQAKFMKGRSPGSGQTGGTDSIQSQIEQLRQKEEFINAQLGRYNQATSGSTAGAASAGRPKRHAPQQQDSDDNIENPTIVEEGGNGRNIDYDDEDEIDSQTLREMREMYGDQLGDSGEEISETEETLGGQDQDLPQSAELDEVLRRANAEAEERVRRLAASRQFKNK